MLAARPGPSRLLAALPLAFAIGALVSACGAPATPPENDLFREASLELEDESYASAIKDYKKLLEEYPFSDKAEIASLNIAYAHFLKGEYGEAIAAFNDFERLYPVSPLLPFVSYTIGMCWLDQARDAERDPTFSDEALRQFIKVANEFPRTIYADLSTFRQAEARENLAAHELRVGDYYRQRKHYDAAAGRYRYVIAQFPTTENAGRAQQKLLEMALVATAAAPPGSGPSPASAAAQAAMATAVPTDAQGAPETNAPQPPPPPLPSEEAPAPVTSGTAPPPNF
jgi:outer membrane protein assembly factor BamD